MREAFCRAMLARVDDPRTVFLTGDLGFLALEPLRDALGERFVNAGLAEQNMVSVAAALAAQAFEVWVYSIAPFLYARPFEHIRNDVSFHGLPVKLVGNGGGYGYGVMGPTHHAIEDYGVLLTLQNVAVYAPAFDEDVADVVDLAARREAPAYVRLGIDEAPREVARAPYCAWRNLVRGDAGTIVAFGAIAGSLVRAYAELPRAERPSLWVLTELPLELHALPEGLVEEIRATPVLCVVEEHVRHGGVASQLALHLALNGVVPRRFVSAHARAHHFLRYGSQQYMRQTSGLDPDSVLRAMAG